MKAHHYESLVPLNKEKPNATNREEKTKKASNKASVKHGHISDSGSRDYNVTEKLLFPSDIVATAMS